MSRRGTDIVCAVAALALAGVCADEVGAEPNPFARERDAYFRQDLYEARTPRQWRDEREGLFGRVADLTHLTSTNAVGDGRSLTWRQTAWRGERVHGQFVVWTGDGAKQLRLRAGRLVSADGTEIPSSAVTTRFVRYVLGWGRRVPQEQCVGDCLDDVAEIDLPPHGFRPLWYTVAVPRETRPGLYRGTFTACASGGRHVDFAVELEVLSAELPRENRFFLDVWQQPWRIARYHGVKPFSKEHYALLEPHYRELAAAGQKTVTVWITDRVQGTGDGCPRTLVRYRRFADGRAEFDFSRFDEYVSFARACGLGPQIHCYTMVRFNDAPGYWYEEGETGDAKCVETVAGTKAWKDYWCPLLVALERHAAEKGWLGDVYIALDELKIPQTVAAAAFVAEVAPRLKFAMAGAENPRDYPGVTIDTYSEALQGTAFLKPAMQEEIDARRARGLATTFYICCYPPRPNAFLHSPPVEQRWPGLYAAYRRYDGMLRWSVHLWNRDPFFGEFLWGRGWAVPGDYWLIYPGPRASVRWEMLRDSIEDYEKIRALRASGRSTRELEAALAEIDFPRVKDLDETSFRQKIERVSRAIDAAARGVQ